VPRAKLQFIVTKGADMLTIVFALLASLIVTAPPGGYWFAIRDTTDPCSFTYISNHSGLIYTAEPLR
jgi:hypothetical protein